jgi:hypothetical protein
MDQMKKAFKGLFSKKKAKKEEHPEPTPTMDKPSSAAPVTEPATTETAPAPAPATAPEPVKPDVTPASSAPEPAAPQPVPASAPAPAPAPAHDGANKDEVAALAEVKEATQSKSTTPPLHPPPYTHILTIIHFSSRTCRCCCTSSPNCCFCPRACERDCYQHRGEAGSGCFCGTCAC